MKARHLAFFLNTLPLGGAERTFVQLAQVFAARGHRVDLVLTRKKGVLLDEVPESVRVVELGKASRFAVMPALLRLAAYPSPEMLALLRRKLPGVVRALPRMERYLREERPDALLATLANNNLLALWAARLCKPDARIVIREANTLSLDNSAGTEPFNELVPALVRRWYPSADAIICVSTGVAEDLAEGFGISPQRLTTIFNPVDSERVTRLATEPVDHAWFSPGSPPVLLSVGRLERQKDYATLLRALTEVRSRREVRLLILGEGSERGSLERLVTSLDLKGAVSMPGLSANSYGYMAKAALFVLSSAWEGFPNVLLEALACGAPIVATDCPSGTTELLAGGRFGRLAPVGDPKALAKAILESLEAPHDRARARSRAADFSLEVTADRYLEAMIGREPRRLMSEPSTPPEAEHAAAGITRCTYPDLQWTPERVAAFWDFESHHPTRYFTHLNGPEMIRQLRRYFETSDSILDYACGPGALLGHLVERGYRVAGTDSSPRSLDVVSTRFSGRDNFLGAYSPDELRSRGQRFDCVFVVELLEHLDDTSLDGTLEVLQRLVHSDGRIIITTPNREELSESNLICPSCERVFHRWQHVRSWSRETLTTFLEERGFEVVEAFSTDFSKVRGRWKAFRKRLRARLKPVKERPHLVVICRPAWPRGSARSLSDLGDRSEGKTV